MSEQAPEATEQTAETAPQAPSEDVSEPETYSADYVKELRAEAAERRVKAKRVDVANERLASAYAAKDGRLVDASELTFSDAMLDDDGLVDPAKVSEAIDELLAAKPYLASQRPQQPIAQGVREDVPDQPGLFSLLRDRM
jgi:hypothetical protein